MKIHTLILFLVLCIPVTQKIVAQNTTDQDKTLYFFLNGFREETSLSSYVSYDSATYLEDYTFFSLNVGILSVGIKLKNKNNMSHFIEIMPIRISMADNNYRLFQNTPEINELYIEGETVTRYSSAITYQPTFNISPQKKVNPYIGLAGCLEYNYFKYTPYESDFFQQSIHRIRFLFQLNPGLEIRLMERIKMDLDIPLTFYMLQYEINNTQNPVIPVNQRTWSQFISKLGPRIFQVRIGVGYSF